jgi:hypothetical protein
MDSSGFDARPLARPSGGGDIDHSCVRFKKSKRNSPRFQTPGECPKRAVRLRADNLIFHIPLARAIDLSGITHKDPGRA